jgi:hypothetical protein
MLLGAAGVFIGIAVVFGVLAYFSAGPQTGSAGNGAVPATLTDTMTLTPPAPSASASSAPAPATPAVVTVTSTQIVAVPAPPSGSGIASIEALASTLGTVVAAACAVIALRPQGRGLPTAPPAPAAAADPPASTPST